MKVSVFSSTKLISSVPLLKQLASFYIYETTLSITNKQYYRFIKTNSPTSKRVRLVTKVLSPACLSSIIMMPSIWQMISTKNVPFHYPSSNIKSICVDIFNAPAFSFSMLSWFPSQQSHFPLSYV